MGNRGCYAFMVSKQQKERSGWTFLFFRVSLSANVGLHSPPPDPFPRKPFPFAPMTFLFAMDEIEAIGAKGRSSISHFPQKMYNIDTDF